MTNVCRILLISDEPRRGAEVRRLLGDTIDGEGVLEHGVDRALSLAVDEIVLSGTWELGLRDRYYHLGIVALAESSPMADLARHPTLLGRLAATLHLLAGGSPPPGTMRPGRDLVLELPCSRTTFLNDVERILHTVVDRDVPPPEDDPRYLTLLQAMIDDGRRGAQPRLTARDTADWEYPVVRRHFGTGVASLAILDRLVDLGVCARTIARRVQSCPTCSSHVLTYGEVCANCRSVDFVREPVIHHFACAHMDTQQAFTAGDALVCPKCRATLRQIGRDYEKPANCYKCSSCAYISGETQVSATCLACQGQHRPEATIERIVYAYGPTAKADEAVAANDLGGYGMASVLRHQGTGLFAKRFFIFSLQQELERLRRYDQPLSLVVVRSTRLIELRATDLEQHKTYAKALWQAARTGLRTLDQACVWAEGVLAIMLPATPLGGADVVLQRIADRLSIQTPGAEQEFVIASCAAHTKHADAQALMAEAIAATAMTDEEPPFDEVVVTDDEETVDTARVHHGPR